MNDIFNETMKSYGLSPLPEEPAVTMAYVPYQKNTEMYTLQDSLSLGTVFPVLDKPFVGNEEDMQ